VNELLVKAATLTEALPWIKRTLGKTIVIKYGGSAMTDAALREHVASDIVLMKLVGINPVIVHGGGPDITSFMERMGLPVTFHKGLRVTTDDAMEVVGMVLAGKVNKEFVADINVHGSLAVGIAGQDANLIRARQKDRELGRVGEVTRIDITVVRDLIGDGFIPVIATIATGEDGGSYNVNADLAAGQIAAALNAEKVIFLTDVDGVYADFQDKSSLISVLTLNEAEEMIASDALADGMIPKVSACMHALRGGVRRAHILNGTVPHSLLLEVYTEEGVGTMIRHADEPWLADDAAACVEEV
jgi:acetylglutamate kinase